MFFFLNSIFKMRKGAKNLIKFYDNLTQIRQLTIWNGSNVQRLFSLSLSIGFLIHSSARIILLHFTLIFVCSTRQFRLIDITLTFINHLHLWMFFIPFFVAVASCIHNTVLRWFRFVFDRVLFSSNTLFLFKLCLMFLFDCFWFLRF